MSGQYEPSQEQIEAAMKKGIKKLERVLELEKEFGGRTLAWRIVEKEEEKGPQWTR